MRVAIVGHGVVGTSVHALFPDAAVHDPAAGFDNPEGVNNADIAFVCVPTPEGPDGHADTSIVRSVVANFVPAIWIIRSTVPPGTSRLLGSNVVFQPEYLGMTPGHAYQSDRDVPWVILGGHRQDTEAVASLYRTVLPPETTYYHTDSTTAELVKYATNTFLATKVEFANELYDAARAAGVDFDRLRELWLLDPRIGRSHTGVDPHDRPFGGACFPKDIAALVAWADDHDLDLPVIEAAMEANRNRSARL